MRLFPILFVFAAAPLAAQDEIVNTLSDDVATLDVTYVTATETPVVIRQAAVQMANTPAITTKTPQIDPIAPPLLPSVDTISGAEIRAYQRYDVGDILRHTAGVSLVQAGQSGGQTSLFIRGTESNHTVVLLNGRRLPPGLAGLYQIEYLDVSTLESVQIARGAVSSLYGSDAIGGAIDLRSTDARFVETNSITSYFEGGSFDTFRNGQRVTLRDGRVGIAIDSSYHSTSNDRPFSDFENGTIRGNIAVDLADGVFFDILGYAQDSNLEVPGSSLNPTFPEMQLNDNRSGLFSPRFTVERDDWDFSVFYSYTTNELTATQDVFLNDNIYDQTGHEAEALFNYHPTDETTYTIGGAYYSNEFTRTPLIPGPFNAPAAFEYAYSSIFAQIDTDLPYDFHLLVSGRYDDQDSFESQGTYTVQLSKEFESTGTMVFGKVSTGYKVPSGQDFIFLAPTVDPTQLEPEESFNSEIGFRQNIFGEQNSVAFTYFKNDIDNLIDVDPFTFTLPTQVDTEIEGIEIEFRSAPSDALDVYLNYTWLDAIIVDGQYFGGFQGGPGDRLPRRPRHALSAGLVVSGDDWKLGAELSGGYSRLDAPGLVLSDYTVARVFGSYQVCKNFELFGRLENVFDTDYETTSGFEAAGIGAFAGARITIGK